ncbi:hypothetical protein QF001_004187 [Paraburkholderia youngii]
MIGRLVTVFFCTSCIWFVVCLIAWVGGSYTYAKFNDLHYSVGWNDITTIIRIALVIAAGFTLITWLKVRIPKQ